MRYLRYATGSVVLPKLIGTYEAELHPGLQTLPWGDYAHFVDVGAGEGYYAVGMCWKYPHLRTMAFEQSARGRCRIRALAARNGVSGRITVQGYCDVRQLQTALHSGRKCFLLMDVEGFETVLMDPGKVPALANTDFIVEVHPERDPEMGEKLWKRFEATHMLTTIRQALRSGKLPAIQVPERLKGKAEYLTNEFRGPQFWLLGIART